MTQFQCFHPKKNQIFATSICGIKSDMYQTKFYSTFMSLMKNADVVNPDVNNVWKL